MDEFVYPEYNGKSLLNVPSTILSLFGAKPLKATLPKKFYHNAFGADKIILFVIDGFGHNLFQKVAIKYSLFRRLSENNFYHRITSVFPSTTAASLGTLNSGLSPLEHGLPEWHVYFQELDCVVQTLPFTPVIPEDLERTLHPPKNILFDQKSIYQRLKELNIPSYALMLNPYSESLYSRTSFIESQIIGYDTLTDFVASLRKIISKVPGKTFVLAYYGAIDAAEHKYGPWTKQVESEIAFLSNALQNEVIDQLDISDSSKVAIFMTADHGQVPVDPAETIYLDEIGGLVENFKKSPAGRIIPPSGAPRDVFLNIKEEKLDETIQFLKEKLKNKATVIKVEKAIKQLFGQGKIHPQFLNRVGNILILAKDFNNIWYHFAPDIIMKHHGLHGGLTQDEMLIPFICARLSQLK